MRLVFLLDVATAVLPKPSWLSYALQSVLLSLLFLIGTLFVRFVLFADASFKNFLPFGCLLLLLVLAYIHSKLEAPRLILFGRL